VQITELLRTTVLKPPPTDFPGQTTTVDIPCTMSGDLTLRLVQDEPTVSASGAGSAEGSGWKRSGDAQGRGAIAAGPVSINFTTFTLLGCSLLPFTLAGTNDDLAGDVLGETNTAPACRLMNGHIQLHRNS
jgi:hypothetical protein